MEQAVSGRVDGHAQIYAALDHVWVQRGLPATYLTRVHKAIELLRSTSAQSSDVELAERIAVALHRIHTARADGDRPGEELLRCELQLLGRAWMQRGSSRRG